ncbi:MAG: hypothetical protein ACRDQA_19790 [Nocardioidaceae bacterium]
MDYSLENLAYGGAGAAMLVLFVWSWIGRSRAARWWAKKDLSPNIAMGILPGVGLLLASVGTYYVFGENVIAITTWTGLLGLPIGLVGFCFPQLWAPKWFKQRRREWKMRARRGSY